MRTTTRRLLTGGLTLALALPPLTGCDAIEEAAGLNEIDVSLGSTGSVAVAPDSTTRSSGSVDIDRDIPGSPGVDDIVVLPGNVTFTPAPSRDAARGSSAAITLSYWVLISNVPAVSGTVTIGDGYTVTGVTTDYTANYTVEDICAAYAAGSCPVSSVLSGGQIDSHVTSALNSGSFTVDLIVRNPSDVAGTLAISGLRFDLNL